MHTVHTRDGHAPPRPALSALSFHLFHFFFFLINITDWSHVFPTTASPCVSKHLVSPPILPLPLLRPIRPAFLARKAILPTPYPCPTAPVLPPLVPTPLPRPTLRTLPVVFNPLTPYSTPRTPAPPSPTPAPHYPLLNPNPTLIYSVPAPNNQPAPNPPVPCPEPRPNLLTRAPAAPNYPLTLTSQPLSLPALIDLPFTDSRSRAVCPFPQPFHVKARMGCR